MYLLSTMLSALVENKHTYNHFTDGFKTQQLGLAGPRAPLTSHHTSSTNDLHWLPVKYGIMLQLNRALHVLRYASILDDLNYAYIIV